MVEDSSTVHTVRRMYESGRLSFQSSLLLGWKFYASETVYKNPPGKVVTVYYDPCGPGRATLEPGISLWNVLGLGLLFLAGWLFSKSLLVPLAFVSLAAASNGLVWW